MAKAGRPAPGRKRAALKVVNPVKNVKKVFKPPKKKGGKRIVCYTMTMLCPPQVCPKCGTKVVAQVDGSYRCPHCYYTWRCTSCDPAIG